MQPIQIPENKKRVKTTVTIAKSFLYPFSKNVLLEKRREK
jgi:hypothetical protein